MPSTYPESLTNSISYHIPGTRSTFSAHSLCNNCFKRQQTYRNGVQQRFKDDALLEPYNAAGWTGSPTEGRVRPTPYAHNLTFRVANIVGSRLQGAVIPNFIQKLDENSETLTILGNGRQEKSYTHVDAMVHVLEHADGPLATSWGRARRPPSTGSPILSATSWASSLTPRMPVAIATGPATSRRCTLDRDTRRAGLRTKV